MVLSFERERAGEQTGVLVAGCRVLGVGCLVLELHLSLEGCMHL